MKKLVVIGMGYVGIPAAALFADTDSLEVVGIQRRSKRSGWKIDFLNEGRSPFPDNEPGMAELLGDRRGFLLDYTFTHRDPFGNGFRYWVDMDSGVRRLREIYEKSNDNLIDSKRIRYSIENARKYVEGRTWDIAVEQVEKALLEAIGDGNG